MKKRSLFILLSLLLACIFAGCGSKDEVLKENEYYLYYVKNDDSELVKTTYEAKTPSDQTEKMIDELVKALKNPTMVKEAGATLNETCKIVDYQIVEGKLSINFDVSYSNLIGVDETLHRAAIVKTLTQIKGVDAIEFLMDDQPLVINKNSVGFMTGEDFIDSIDGNGTTKTMMINIYFANKQGTKLIKVPKKVSYDSTIPIGQLMVSEMLVGPGENSKGLQKTIADDTVLNSMTIRDHVCYVDFSTQFTNVLPNVSSEVTVFSVVNTLVELPNVNKVQFSIDGEHISKFGNMDFGQAFERNLNVVENE